MGVIIPFPGRFGPLRLVGDDVTAVIVRHGPIAIPLLDLAHDALSALHAEEEVELP